MTPVAMTQHVVTRNGFWVGFVALLQTVMPPIVAVGFLYYLVRVFDAALAEYFNSMAVLVAILMLLLPYPARDPHQPIFPGSLPIVVSVLVRWAILLAALLAIAYVTKFSAHYSRRIVLTWAMVTPAMLVAVNLVFHEFMRRLMCNPENARRTVFAGYNEVSRNLARQLRMSSEYCMSVQGFFDDRSADRLQPNGGDRLLGRPGRPAGLDQTERRRGHLHLAARRASQAHDRAAQPVARHDGLRLLRARHRGLRPHPVADGHDQRHPGDRNVRDADLRLPVLRQAADRRDRLVGRARDGVARAASPLPR